MIDLSRALKYPFSGPGAITKTIIGGLLAAVMPLLLPVFVLLGYQLRVIRAVIKGDDRELPEWDDLGGDLVAGVKVFLGTVLYHLPALILAGLGAWLALGALADLDVMGWLMRRDPLDIDRAKLSMMLVCFLLALIWMVLSAPLVMCATAYYAETGQFSAFVNILERADEVWAQRKTAGALTLNLFALVIVTQVATLALSVVLPMTCLFGAYIQFIYFSAAWHLNGQWAIILKEQRRRNIIRPLKPARSR
jgi:hypothetical protein